MDLDYIENKLNEIYKLRDSILTEIKDSGVIKAVDDNKFRLTRKFDEIKKMRVACVMDEFTFNSFSPECIIKQITPGNWKFELQEFQPDLFFLESAWNGLDGLWNTKVAFFSNDLIEVLGYCKLQRIPIVFWNKEDPVHFNTFASVARYADFVFTTDIDCIARYKGMLGHSRVYLLPFAAQSKNHNPTEMYPRENKFSFAGAYYKRYPERVRDLENIINLITDDKKNDAIDIYDRNYFNKVSSYKFPKKYRKYIRGNLKSKEIHKAYKGYRFNINMNSVKQSQSMCARRVFEVLGSNTVLLSNYSRAVRNLFGDLVLCTDDMTYLKKMLDKFSDEEYYEKFKLAGLRKIYSEHTYRHRLEFISNVVFGGEHIENKNNVAIVTVASSKEDIDNAIRNFQRQRYLQTDLFVFAEIDFVEFESDRIHLIKEHSHSNQINFIRTNYDFLAFFSNQDYYGEYYIYDLVLAAQYTDQSIICKNEHYLYSNNSFSKRKYGSKYTVCQNSLVRSSLIRMGAISNEDIVHYYKTIDTGMLERQCFSIDEFNYCMNYKADKCITVDDLPLIDTGIELDEVHKKATKIPAKVVSPGESLNSFASGCFLNKSNVLLITDNYPDYNDLYRYAFVHARIIEYKKNGFSVDVFKFNERYPKGYSEFYGIDIMSGYFEELNNLLMSSNYHTILLHFLSESIWNGVKKYVKGKKIIVWLHGSEIQPWWRRKFNYTNQKEIEDARELSDRRIAFWKYIFDLAVKNREYEFHFIFVSEYFAENVFTDLNVRLPKEMYSVIHNYINNDIFKFVQKDTEVRKNILSIRPFTSKTYANDLTVKTILELSKEPFFSELNFRIVGQGELFRTTLKPIKKFKNVTIEEKFLRQDEIAQLHSMYGIFLVPTRMDSQGVSRDEAMSSGLVPVTNRVAAIPEFVDENCGMLANSEDFMGLADSIKALYYNPTMFQLLSKAAAERVRRQSSYHNTIKRELDLIK